jgi:hypothetical protein
MVALLEKSPLPPKSALRARGDILHLVAPVRARHKSRNRNEFNRFTYKLAFGWSLAPGIQSGTWMASHCSAVMSVFHALIRQAPTS